MKKNINILLILIAVISCKKEDGAMNQQTGHDHIEYFGFTLVDTYWDDPTDTISQSNYAEEIHLFSNAADILVLSPEDDIEARIDLMDQLDMKALLHLNEIFFEVVGTESPSGTDYDLRSDFQDRWDAFVEANDIQANQSKILSFYMGEEPTWNGISYMEFKAATDYVKAQFPSVPIMLIEAYPVIDSLQVPTSVDWIGFDHYFIKDPTTDADIQYEWNAIKEKRSTQEQRLVVIMDTHYISWAHGDFGNIALEEMKEVATNYYSLAQTEQDVIAVIGYFWPNGFEFPESIGARGMPDHVIEEYVRIGKEITGKE